MCNRAIASLCLAVFLLTSCGQKQEVPPKPAPTAAAEPASPPPPQPPPSNGSWTEQQFCDAARSVCTVEISSMVQAVLTCSVSWHGTSTTGNAVHGQLGLLIPAYPGFGGAIIGHKDVPNILGNFAHTTTCNH
jgi:hypothetical protein